MVELTRPFILYAAFPAAGHIHPALQIMERLLQAGYDVSMLAGDDSEDKIRAAGLRFYRLRGLANLTRTPEFIHMLPELLALDSADPETIGCFSEASWTLPMTSQLESVRAALADLKQRAGAREVLVLSDVWFAGLVPFHLGAELPEGFDAVPRSIGIGIVPPQWVSADSAPFGMCLPPDASESGRLRNRKLAALWARARNPLTGRRYRESCREALVGCGVSRPVDDIFRAAGCDPSVDQPVWAASSLIHNVTLQMCLPSLEYPAADRPPRVRFGGTLPPKPLSVDLAYPPWFDELRANSKKTAATTRRKRIVVVAQGTVEREYDMLVVPTLRALEARGDELLVVANLCVRSATLDRYRATTLPSLPANARVVDYFPYDALLEHADVFVTNSGYGGFQHAVANAVPTVQSGMSGDKPEIGLRTVHAGLGVQIMSNCPTPDEIAAAVGKVLDNPGYAARAEELRKEAEEFDALGTVERELEALWKTPASS